MKFPAIISAFVLPLALHAGPITQKPLDEFLIYDIPVAFKSGTTTIMFPSESPGFMQNPSRSRSSQTPIF